MTTIKPSDIHYLLLYDILLYFIISPCLYFIFMNIARKTSNTVQHHWTVLPDMIYFLYPHLGHTPSSLFSATPHNGQHSMLCLVENSADPAFTPLVNVIFAMFNLSFNKSYTILIMPSTVMVSLVTTKRASG